MRQYLVAQGTWNREAEEHALADAAAAIERAAETYLATPPQPVSAMFDYMFANLPVSLLAQRARAIGGEENDA